MTPGRALSILRLWWEADRLFFRQQPAWTAAGALWLPDLEVVGLQGDLVQLLAHPFDLDDGPAEEITARREGPDRLQVVAHQSLPAANVAELKAAFDAPLWGSDEFFEQCCRERVLMADFRLLNRPVDERQLLTVGEVKSTRFSLVLEDTREEFEPLALHGELLAVTPPSRTYVEPSPPIYVCRIEGDGLRPASPAEFVESTRHWLSRLESPERCGHYHRAFRLLSPTEVEAVTDRLRQLTGPAPPPVRSPWLGRRLGRYQLEELLGEGGFSQVFRGVHQDGHAQLAFKIALQRGKSRPDHYAATMAGHPGAWGEALPEPAWLVAEQASRLMAVHDPGLVHVEELVVRDDLSYYAMELLEGPSLRSLMRRGRVPLSALLRTARTLQRLSRNSAFPYHGDLKPDNILVSPGGVHLLDPGYFGPDRYVTTPAYYPRMQPDDLAAFAIILWEIAAGRHPLAQHPPSQMAALHPGPPPAPLGEWVWRAWQGQGDWLEVLAGLEGLLDQGVMAL